MLRDYATSPPEFTFMKDSISITNELLENIENDLLETRQYINTRKVNNYQTKELMRLLQDDNMILIDKVSNLEHLLYEQTNQLKHTNHILSQECNDQLLTNQSEMERILLQCNEAINEKNNIEHDLHTTKELCFKLSNELNSNKEIILQNKNTIDYLTLQNMEYALALTAALQKCSELETKTYDCNPTNYSNHISNNSYNVNSITNRNNEDTNIIHDQSIDHNHHNNIRMYNNNNSNSIHSTTNNNDNHNNYNNISIDNNNTTINNDSNSYNNYNNNNINNNYNNKFPTKVVTTNTASSLYDNDHSHHEELYINNQSIDITTINKNTTTTNVNTKHIQPMKASSSIINNNIHNERQLVSPCTDDDDAMEAYEYIEQEPSPLLVDQIATRILSESLNSSNSSNSSSKEMFESIQLEPLIYHHNIIEQPQQHLVLPHTNTTVSTISNPNNNTNTIPLYINKNKNNSYKPISATAAEIHTSIKNDDNLINNLNNYYTSSSPSEEYQHHINPYIDNNKHDINPYIDNNIDPAQYEELDGEPFETSYYDAISDTDDTSNNNYVNDDNFSNNYVNDDNFSNDDANNNDNFSNDDANNDDNFSNNYVNDDNFNNNYVNDYNDNNNDNSYNNINNDENRHQYGSNINIYSNINNTNNSNINNNNNNQIRDNEDYNSNYDDDSLEDDHYIDEKIVVAYNSNNNNCELNTGRCNVISFYENTESNMNYNYIHEYNNNVIDNHNNIIINNNNNNNNNNLNQKDGQYSDNIDNNDIKENDNTESDNRTNSYHHILIKPYDNNIILNTKTSVNASIYDMVDNNDDLEQFNLEELSMLSL